MPPRRRASPAATKAVGYLRVSTTDQALSPEAQRAAIERWCAAQSVQLVEVHEDRGVSGGAPPSRRPGLLAAIDAIQAGRAGRLVVARWDRLARDVMVQLATEQVIARSGARIESADGCANGDSPEAKLLRNNLAGFAEYERAIIGLRTAAVLAVRKSRGERAGQIPFGYRVRESSPRLEPDEREQRAIALARRLRAGGLTLRAVTAELNRRAPDAARGDRWHLTTVARLLRRAEETA